jgi:type IV pilus assembly protein PilC
MAEYKLEGLTVAGRPVSGMISADTLKDAKQRASLMAIEKKFKLTGVFERVTFLYRVQKGTEKPIDGEQKAYTKDEVKQALEKMGYRVLYVRKKLFGNKQRAAPPVEIITFVRMSADLMRQKLPFNEILLLLMNDITNPALKDAVKEINSELKQGKDSEKVSSSRLPSLVSLPRTCLDWLQRAVT